MPRNTNSDTPNEREAATRQRTTTSHAAANTRRELNWRVVIVTLVGLAILIPGVFFLHRFQVNRLVGAFLDRATKLESNADGLEEYAKELENERDGLAASKERLAASKEWLAASKHLQNYLRLRPDNSKQRVRLARVFGQTVARQPHHRFEAVRLYHQAIAEIDDDEIKEELRRKVLPLLITLRRFQQAEMEVLRQPRSEPDGEGRRLLIHPEDRRLFAQAVLGRVQIGSIIGPFKLVTRDAEERDVVWTVGDVLQQALESMPSDPELTVSLCEVYRNMPKLLPQTGKSLPSKARANKADQLIKDMVAAASADAEAQMADAEVHLADAEAQLAYAEVHLADPEAQSAATEAQLAAAEAQSAAAEAQSAAAEAHLAAHDYRDRYSKSPGIKDEEAKALSKLADANLDEALKLATGNVNVLLAAARRAKSAARLGNPSTKSTNDGKHDSDNLAKASEQLETAENYYSLAIDVNPTNEVAYWELGTLLMEQEKPEIEDAIDIWQTGLDTIETPGFQLRLGIADAMIRLGQNPEKEIAKLESSRDLDRLLQSGRDSLRQQTLALKGRWALDQGRPADAARYLRDAISYAPANAPATRPVITAHALLAMAYEKLEVWDRAARQYELLSQIQSDALSTQSLRSAARTWRQAGQPGLAIAHYRSILAKNDGPLIEENSALVRLLLADTILSEQLSKTLGSRNWSAYTQAQVELDKCKNKLPNPWSADLLYSRYVNARSLESDDSTPYDELLKEAIRRLVEAQKDNQDSQELLVRLVTIYQQLDKPKLADQTLNQFESISSPTDLALLRAQLLVLRGEFENSRQVLAKQLAKSDPDDASVLRTALSQIDRAEGISQTVDAAATYDPNNPNVSLLMRLASAALSKKDFTQVDDLLKSLEKLEGKSTRHKLLEARKLLVQEEDLEKAASLQAEIQRDRPNWPDGYLLKAGLAHQRGDVDGAISAYEQAIQLGERRLQVLEGLARLMWSAGRTDVDDVLNKMGSHVATSVDLTTMGIKTAMAKGDLEDAEHRAIAGVKSRPTDPMAQIWLGKVLLSKGDLENAENKFGKATALEPKELLTWNSLFGFYLQTKQIDRARATLDDISKEVEFKSDGEKQFTIAQFEYQLGDKDAAKERLARAVELAQEPKLKVQILFKAAQFDREAADSDAAIQKLETARQLEIARQLDPSDKRLRDEVRRALAGAYAARDKGDDFEKSLKYLPDVKGDDIQSRDLDQRLRAILYARQADGNYRENVAKAIAIYEELVRKNPVQPGDRLQLGNLYATQSQIGKGGQEKHPTPESAENNRVECLSKAREQFVDLVSTDAPDYKYVVEFFKFLSYNGFHRETENWLGSLKKSMLGDQSRDLKPLSDYLGVLVRFDCNSGASRTLDEIEVQMIELERDPVSELSAGARANFIRFCLRMDQPEKARRWLDDLEATVPNQLSVVALRAQWLHAMKQDSDIKRLIEAFAKPALAKLTDKKQQASFCFEVGQVYSEIKQYKNAMPWYELVADSTPTGFAQLALCLARRGRTSEMLRVSEKAIPSVGLTTVATKLAVILSGLPNASKMSLHSADDLIAQALEASPDDQTLLLTSAALRARQQQVVEAAELYEQVLDKDPRNTTALNNLATLLQEIPGREMESLTMVDRAIVYAGVHPVFLDTRGTALIKEGRNEEAVSVLRAACWSPKADARHWFHLAIALERTKRVEESKKAFRIALDNGLVGMLLTPDDLLNLSRLRKKWKMPATTTQTRFNRDNQYTSQPEFIGKFPVSNITPVNHNGSSISAIYPTLMN